MDAGRPQARRYWVSGLVQGVGFRFFVERAARELGLAGYVRNLRDGRVEVYAVGAPEQLAALRRRLEQGPPGARVREVVEEPAEWMAAYSRQFAIVAEP
jgi:acylphosphatase